MKMKVNAIIATVACMAGVVMAAQTSTPVGYCSVSIASNSEVIVSVPFTKTVEQQFTVSLASGNSVTVNEVIQGSFATGRYYLLVTSGANEGRWSTISGQGSSGFDLSDADLLTGVVAGDAVAVYAYQTVIDMFPSEYMGTVYPTTMQVVLPKTTTTGWNKLGTVLTYNSTAKAWRSGLTSYNNTVIKPGAHVVVRTQAAGVTVAQSGVVPSTPIVIKLDGVQDDLYVTTGYPVAITVAGLEATSTIGQLVIAQNSNWNDFGRILTYSSGHWKSGLTSYDSTVLGAAQGFKIRRPSGASTLYFKIPKPY